LIILLAAYVVAPALHDGEPNRLTPSFRVLPPLPADVLAEALRHKVLTFLCAEGRLDPQLAERMLLNHIPDKYEHLPLTYHPGAVKGIDILFAGHTDAGTPEPVVHPETRHVRDYSSAW